MTRPEPGPPWFGQEIASQAPVDNAGVPAVVLADHAETMDQAMDDLGVSGLGGIVRPTQYENRPLKGAPDGGQRG